MACLTTADSDVAGEETKEALLQTLGTGMARPRGLESRPAARAGRGGGVLPDPFIHIVLRRGGRLISRRLHQVEPATVDGDGLSVDEGGMVRDKEEHAVGYVLREPQPADC